jgi:hypothetical protein
MPARRRISAESRCTVEARISWDGGNLCMVFEGGIQDSGFRIQDSRMLIAGGR